jgi:hypothetical protein
LRTRAAKKIQRRLLVAGPVRRISALLSNIAQAAMPFQISFQQRAEATMDSFLYEQNLELLQRHLAESDPTKNPQRHNMLLRLLAEEKAKEKK